jgi:hypothetical protein
MTAFTTSRVAGIIKPNQRRTLFGVIKYVVARGFFWWIDGGSTGNNVSAKQFEIYLKMF